MSLIFCGVFVDRQESTAVGRGAAACRRFVSRLQASPGAVDLPTGRARRYARRGSEDLGAHRG